MKYGSVCSGIEAATVAWHPLGWQPQWFSEIEKFPSKVLQHHYPEVPNLGDMTKLFDNEAFQNSTIDLFVGGTPCQSFSVAGLRNGMADPRGNLALVFLKILDVKRPKWVVWENVSGVLSSWSDAEEGEEGEIWQTNDFDTFLSGLRELGYSCTWRILDAQYFGVPQRRRRVFVVGHLGNDWRPSTAVLFERESLRRDITPRRETREEITGKIETGAFSTSGQGYWREGIGALRAREQDSHENLIAVWPANTTTAINALFGDKLGLENQHINNGATFFVPHTVPTLCASGVGTHRTGNSRTESEFLVPFGVDEECNASENLFGPLLRGGQGGTRQAVVYDTTQITSKTNRSNPQPNDSCHTLAAGAHAPLLIKTNKARRLTPLECARLQGFPDNYTSIPGASDGVQYKAYGNSMAVPVMRWIGERIEQVNKYLYGK